MIRRHFLAAGLAATLAVPAAAQSMDVAEVAAAQGDLDVFLEVVEAAGLTSVLHDDGPITVFAPTDTAFAELPPNTLAALLADPDRRVAFVAHHVVSGNHTSANLPQDARVDSATLKGATVQIRTGGGIVVDEATVVRADMIASNGVVHAIDKVVLPAR